MLDTRAEAARKLIHISTSLGAAAIVWILPRPLGAIILAAAAGVAMIVEVARQLSPRFHARFQRWFGPLLRPGERHRLTGAATLAVGYAFAAAIFAAATAVAAILVTGIADAAAALIGKRFGRLRYPGGKSVLGSTAFFLVAWALIAFVSGVGVGAAALAAFFTTIVEAPALPVDDNLFLPAATGVAIIGAAHLLGGG